MVRRSDEGCSGTRKLDFLRSRQLYYEYDIHPTDAEAAKFPFSPEDNRKNTRVKQKGIPWVSADSWSRQAAVDGQAFFLYLTVK